MRRQARVVSVRIRLMSELLLGLPWTLQIIEARIEVALERRRHQPPEAPAIMTNKLEPALLELRHIVACLRVVVLDDRDGVAASRGVILSPELCTAIAIWDDQ